MDGQQGHEGNYKRFMAMVGTSTAIMFGLMYLNTYALDHVMWSETRFWMTFVMGAVMAVVMLLFMWGMYKNAAKNGIIIGVSVLTFALALWLVRSQETIDDSEYMSAMIPHHSIAIMTSERAHIEDKRVQELANSIIKAQRKEIAEMKWLLDDIEKNGVATTADEASERPVPKFEGYLNPDGGATP
ncbi:DUF305 domain-containing protein [Erythrobacter sp. SD-21]|uniref:DUF305 domain-containing protein n=1 Tax=Erythrobacter sp. SD-21 TaxID=161528 RepID=UPI000153EFB8|nr:DUF305 domain-containing protein [Erythrobacter sp. SD-21]EDL48734.1 hypothetical protein ED21_31054 [Erythrobacter sp. SD-21]